MAPSGILGKLFKKKKESKRDRAGDTSAVNSGILDTPPPCKLTPNASTMSKSDSVDSIHFHKLKLSRFLEKRWVHHDSRHDEPHQSSHKFPVEKSNNSNNIVSNGKNNHDHQGLKPSKFNDFQALVQLTSKYGTIPNNEENLLDLYNNKVSHTVSEAASADDALIIGKGAGGSVFPLFNAESGKVYAMKKIRQVQTKERWNSYTSKLKEEFDLANGMHHQNVVRTYDLLEDRDLFIIVMDYIPYDFFTLIMAGEYSTEEAYCYFKQMVNGVAYLHGRGIAHRDLKLDNCVVDKDGILKLVDFGSAVIWDPEMYNSGDISTAGNEITPKSPGKVTGILGSDPYLSPEVFYQSYYDPTRADVWSMAIVFCCMVIHQFPWRLPKPREDKSYNMFTMKDKEIVDEKGKKKIVGPQRVLNKLPEESRELIGQMFELFPDKRISIFDVQRNKFFKEIVNCCYDTETGAFIPSPTHTHHFVTRQEYDSEQNTSESPQPAPAPSKNVKSDASMIISPIILDQEKSPQSSN